MIEFFVGFLLFCLCLVVAIRLWQPLVAVAGIVVVIGIVVVAVDDIRTRVGPSVTQLRR